MTKLKSKIVIGAALIAASGFTYSAQSSNKEIQSLQQKVEQLENKLMLNSAMDNASDESVSDFMEDINFSAFISVGLARTTKKEGFFPGKIDEHLGFSPNTVLGMQMTYKINDKFDMVGQLVSRSNSKNAVGRADWQLESDWAYISYKATSQLQLRAGRLRLPIYLYSDYLEVGYAYPWISPPTEVYYEEEITTYEGSDAIYNLALSENWELSLQGFFGGLNDITEREGVVLDFEIRNFAGMNATFSNGDLTFRLGHTQGEQDFCANTPIVMPIDPTKVVSATNPQTVRNTKTCFDDIKFSFQGLGIRYQANNILAVSEVIRYESKEDAQANTQAGYLTLGYNIGSWMPHVTFGKTSNFDDDKVPAKDKTQQSSITLGSRFNVAENVAFKVEVKKVSGFGKTNGQFNGAAVYDDDAYVYSAVIDATF